MNIINRRRIVAALGASALWLVTPVLAAEYPAPQKADPAS
jgi:hypothetical protein